MVDVFADIHARLSVSFGVSNELAVAMLLTGVLIALTAIDLDHQLLPDSLTLPLLWVGLLINIDATFVSLESAVLGAVFGYLCLWSVYWLFKIVTGKEGMGYGDFKLLAALGAWFGLSALPTIVLLSSLVGASHWDSPHCHGTPKSRDAYALRTIFSRCWADSSFLPQRFDELDCRSRLTCVLSNT